MMTIFPNRAITLTGLLLVSSALITACQPDGSSNSPDEGATPPAALSEPGTPSRDSISRPPDSDAGDLGTTPADPIDPSSRLTARGWGPLHIGITRDEVVAAAGEDANPEAVGGPDPANCDEFRPTGAPAGLLVMIEKGLLTRISLGSGSRIQTDRGFRVGDEASRVEAAYGDSAISTPHAYVSPPGEYLTIQAQAAESGEPRGLVYEIGPEGRITRIHGGGPSIKYVEGCL